MDATSLSPKPAPERIVVHVEAAVVVVTAEAVADVGTAAIVDRGVIAID